MKSWVVVLVAGVGSLMLSAPKASAVPLTLFSVSINTSGLGGGLFALDFQLNDGSGLGDGNSLVTLTNFNFGTGSPSGAAVLTNGANGDVITGASIADSAFFNGFLQNFVAGNSLSFTVGLALAADVGPTPDLFSMAILDVDGTSFEIPTHGPLGVEFLSFQTGDAALQAFGADSSLTFLEVSAPDVSRVPSAVPEPATLVLFGAGLMGVAAARRWHPRFSRRQ